MKKLLFLSFFGLFLLACTTDEGDGAPFVTDVVMPRHRSYSRPATR